MKNLYVMIIYQFKIVTRNRTLLVASMGIAIISMLIFGFLFQDTGTRTLQIGVVDLDNSTTSKNVVTALKKDASLKVATGQQDALIEQLKAGDLAAVIILKKDFGQKLPQGQAQAQLYVDETDIIGAARSKGTINAVFDAVSKQTAGYKDLIRVQEQQVTSQKLRTIDYLTPGMIGLTILYANIYSGMVLTSWRLNGTLKRLNATPLHSWQLIIAHIISQFLLSFVQSAVVIAIAIFVFHVHITLTMLPAMALFVLVGSFSMISLGYAIGNFVPKPNAAQAVATLIALPMMFLGGSYFPVETSGFLTWVVEVAPLTHLNRAFQQIMLNEAQLPVLLPELGFLLLIGGLLLLLSIRTFRWSW